MQKRILFLVDHKHRDLPSLSLIGYLLKEKGHSVEFSTLGDEEKKWETYIPHLVVANKQIGDNTRLQLCKAHGIKRAVINTEGARRKGRLLTIEVPPELIFYWNEDEFNRYRIVPELKKVQHKLVGSPRLDFLTKPFEVLYPTKQELLAELGMNEKNFTVTIATHTVAAFHSPELQEFKRKQLKEVFNIALDYDTIFNNSVENLKVTVEFLKNHVKDFPEINFVLKPHPNEDVNFWKQLIEKEINLPNLKLVLGMTINEFLGCSDLHIAHNGCTTTAEALLKQIPTIEILSKNYEKIFPEDRMELANFKVWNDKEILESLLFEKKQSRKGKLSNYLAKPEIEEYLFGNFYKSDSKRCFEHFKVLHKFTQEITIEPIRDNKQIKKLQKSREKKFMQYGLRYELGAIKRNIFRSKTPMDKTKTSGDPRGRYDNSIKPGDEKYWFDKFEKAGFNISFFESLPESNKN